MVPRLEDMPLWMRMIVALIAIVIAALLILILDVSGEPQHPALTESIYDARMAQLERLGVEQAFQQQIQKMFSLWVTGYHERPPAALRGAANARRGYIRAMTEIDAREKELQRR